MNYLEFKPIYDKISRNLNLNFEEEKIAARNLNNKLKNINYFDITNLKKKLAKKDVIIFGAGPSLEPQLQDLKILKNKVILSADGATSALLENKINPDIIVTDLDGKVKDQIKANKKGSIVILHAHADNIKQINNYINDFNDQILGTIQINPKPYEHLHNFGGFTDGDRAIFLTDHFKAKSILLAGFDFNGKIGKYSFADKKNQDLKLKKLKWCKKLIKILIEKNPNISFLK